MRNPVKHHMHKSVRASVEPCKKTFLKSDATLRDAREIVSEGLFDSETMCFDDDGNGCCTGCLGDIGCSSISVNTFEDEGEEL